MRRFGWLVLPILLFAADAFADAETELTMAIVAFGQGDLVKARQHLEAAQQQTTDPALLAKVDRQKGIIDSVEGKNLAAVLSFMRALYFDPKTELDPREHRGEVQRLFDCAYLLHERGLSEKAVEVRYADAFSQAGWECPKAEAAPPPPPPTVRRSEPPPPLAEPPVRREKDMGPVWKSPVLWVAIVSGVVFLGAATATGFVVARDDPFTGSTGTNVVLRR